jgi:hypothetical protein
MEQGSLPVGSVDEIYQAENPTFPTVPVEVRGNVQVHQVPARSAGSRNWTGVTTATRVGNQDPRRKRAVIDVYSATATDYVILGADQNEVDTGYGFRLAANRQLEITHQEALYVKANAVGVVVSVLNEQWAD